MTFINYFIIFLSFFSSSCLLSSSNKKRNYYEFKNEKKLKAKVDENNIKSIDIFLFDKICSFSSAKEIKSLSSSCRKLRKYYYEYIHVENSFFHEISPSKYNKVFNACHFHVPKNVSLYLPENEIQIESFKNVMKLFSTSKNSFRNINIIINSKSAFEKSMPLINVKYYNVVGLIFFTKSIYIHIDNIFFLLNKIIDYKNIVNLDLGNIYYNIVFYPNGYPIIGIISKLTKIFEKCKKIKKLNLSNLFIPTYLPKKDLIKFVNGLKCLDKLEYLDISSCELEYVIPLYKNEFDKSIFVEFIENANNLKNLVCKKNLIYSLRKKDQDSFFNAISNNKNITSLSLMGDCYNDLYTNLYDDSAKIFIENLKKLQNIEHLNMKESDLSFLSREMIDKFMKIFQHKQLKKLITLDMRGSIYRHKDKYISNEEYRGNINFIALLMGQEKYKF